MFNEEDIKAVQQYKCQKAQLKMYQDNLGLIRIIGLQYGVRDMEAYLQDAYIALGDACRLYNWDKSFLACYRIHLKKAVFMHKYLYEYPVRVDCKTCKNVTHANFPPDIPSYDSEFEYVENSAVLEDVIKVIGALADSEKDILRRRFICNESFRYIAAEYGVSSVTVYNHLNRILIKIREQVS